jgi:uncharacterized protein YfaS (alpha-2-macroglobulin family)
MKLVLWEGKLRPWPLMLLLLGASAAGVASRQAPDPGRGAGASVAIPSGTADWKEVDRLVSEQKFDEAQKKVDAILAAAQKRGDEENWTRALVRHAQVEIGLHGYETAVRFLKENKWPSGLLSRVTLDLFYGQTLVTYARAYSWEIGQRERVESSATLDLKAWTREQIYAEAARSYLDAWGQRGELGSNPVGRLSEYLEGGTYPPEIRGTLRDAITYMLVELLADTTGWTPAQSNEVHRLDLSRLLEQEGAAAQGQLEKPELHPVEKVVTVLADLEAWHAAAGRRGAELEARLERLRRLHAAFTQERNRGAIRHFLEERLARDRDIPWWSAGMATFAQFLEAEDAPDNLIRALAAARAGAKAYPESPGGQLCRSIAAAIAAPDFQLASMSSDAPGRRSIQVTHKNLPALHFRAYPVDLVQRLESVTDYNLLPAGHEAKKLIGTATPAKTWSVDLPATADYKVHRTFVAPPMSAPGLYVVLASARKDFAEPANRIRSVNLVVTDLVLVTRLENSTIEARALTGRSGAAVSTATVTLYRFDWNRRHAPVESKKTGSDGFVRFDWAPGREGKPYFLLARKGKDATLDANYLSLVKGSEPSETTQSLVYTDRSIYRPLQTLDWKVLVFRGRRDLGRFAVSPSSVVSVSLVDANNQRVEQQTVSTNSYGTASGQFRIPAGRILGNWRVESSANGSASVSVEEYKRPTFEVTWKDPEGTPRLNRPVRLTGSARYYFGLPVAHGTVVWSMTRQPEIPWWWWHWGWINASLQREQTVAQGNTPVKEDGTFEISFTPEADERLKRKQKELVYRYSVTAHVTDEWGETREASRSLRIGTVAIEAAVSMDTAFFREGGPAHISVLRSDTNGVPRPGEGSWRLVEAVQPPETLLPSQRPVAVDPAVERYATPGDRQRARWETQENLDAIWHDWADGKERVKGIAKHDAKGIARVELPELPAGVYRLRYETVDEFGGRREIAKEFLVAGRRTPLRAAAVLLAESSSVPVGGVARLFVGSGFSDQPLSLEIFRDGKLKERRELAGGRRSLIEIPIGEKDRGGFGVRLTFLRDHQYLAPTVSIFVPWDDKKLSLSFATFRDKIRPGTSETWRITLKSPDGRPVEQRTAELLAYMYDRSLDAFRPHTPPDPLSVYPNHTAVGFERASLGETYGQWVSNNGFGDTSRGPVLVGDHLKFFGGYAIGGMGRRGMMLDGVAAGRAQPASVSEGQANAKSMPAREESGALQAADKKEAAGNAAAPAPELRSNFSETAFWQPHLLTDASGAAVIEFTVPDSVTSWKVFVHAVTRDLKGGSVQKETQSVKDLMVRPYVPRFLREGDRADLKVVVNNASAGKLAGKVSIEIVDVETNGSAAAEFGLPASGGSAPFAAEAGGSTSVTFPVSAPRRVGTYAFKVTAVAGDVSDGELRPVPVLPGRMHLIESRFVAVKEGSPRTMKIEEMAKTDDPTRIDEQLVVTVDAQLFESVLNALPYLVHYPYECTEQTLNRFVPTAIVSALFRDYPAVAKMAEGLAKRETRLETWDAQDPNRKMALEETPWLREARGGRETGGELVRVLDPKIAQAERDAALAKLAKAQTASGGFPWWPGGPPSPYMTIYILHGFANALEFGAQQPKELVEKAWGYVRGYVRDDLERCMALDGCWEFTTFINYTLSSYPDSSWYAKAFSPQDRQRLLDFSFKHWKQHAPYCKAQLAMTLKRMGRGSDAELVWASVMDSSKTDPDLGTYWAREDRSWLWYNDTIETQAFALRALEEVTPKDSRGDGLVTWLFLNKKLNQWKSTKATAEVIASLAHYLKKQGALSVREAVSVTVGSQKVRFVFEPDRYTGAKNQVVVPGEKIDPKTSSTISVEKEGKGLAFASATWHFSTEKLPAQGRGDFFSVSRRYFVRESTKSGFVLKPLSNGASVAVGDQIEVQVSLTSKHAAEYVHLRDPRAAGLEPENVLSRYKWDLGISWYEETRDSGTNFFFEQLPVGEYTFKYRLRANMSGIFKVSPATVQSMYAPEFNAFSAGAVLTVK